MLRRARDAALAPRSISLQSGFQRVAPIQGAVYPEIAHKFSADFSSDTFPRGYVAFSFEPRTPPDC
jgi:hypothetical protein